MYVHRYERDAAPIPAVDGAVSGHALAVAHLRGAVPDPDRRPAGRTGTEVGAESVAALHEVGCVAVVRQIAPTADGKYDLLTVGTDRFRLVDVDRSRPYLQGEIELLPDDAAGEPGAAEAAAGTVRQVQGGFRAYLNALADQ